MKKSILAIFTLGILALCAYGLTARADDSASDDGQFRVMSFNIRLRTTADGDNIWDNRKETLVDVVKQSDPLLLGVQEALPEQMDYLNEALSDYTSIGVGRDDGVRAGECMAIFYKTDALELLDSGTFWLSKTPEKPGKGWDAACNRTVTWGKFRCKKSGKELVYANTHLDHVGTIARKEGAKLVLRRMDELTNHGELPFFISGDFNVNDKSEAYVTITQGLDGIPGLIDTNKVAKEREAAQEYTFHSWGKVQPENGQIIDFIFVNDRVNVEKFKINPLKHTNGRYASDHVSIVATLSLK
ncbi:MAG: endonuclease/exonuclease/phosphatase family protein [Planctomycetia bacterium]|nr:endonuclease/exonuclease/phosphatase family protein [Planctomycetia bacterium]